MVESNFKMTEDKQLRDFEKQTVFKRPGELNDMEIAGAPVEFNEKIAGSLAYLLGFISGFFFLLVEKENRFIRFHAIQSIYISIVFFTVFTLLSMLPLIGWLSGVILSPIGLVLWIILMLNAYSGKYAKIFYIGEIVEKQLR